MARRKHSKIDKLPDTLRQAVEQMMQSDFTYSEICDYIKQSGHDISIGSVFRYAQTLNASVQQIRMAQENFRVIMDEINKYPMLDTSEGIIRLLSHHLLETIQNTSQDQWNEVDPATLIKQGSALIRAASYKTNTDLKNKDILDAGYEQVKTMVFEAMSKERPDLYRDVSGFLAAKSQEVKQ